MTGPMLTRRSAVLLAMETTYDTLPTFTPSTDGFYVDAPDFIPDIQILQRKVVQPSLSRRRHVTGYKLAKIKFSAEMNFNGLAEAGTTGVEPIIGRMFRGCGMSRTAHATPFIDTVFPQTPDAATAATFTSSAIGISTYTGPPVAYIIECTTPGASATAAVKITPHDTTLDTTLTSQVLTDASPQPLGALGATITPTIGAGGLVAGQQWVVVIYPGGLIYKPISTGFESVGLKFYADGSVHAISGAFGSFTLKAQAANIVMADFEFTGRWHSYADEAFPAVAYPDGVVPVMEAASLALGTFQPIVETMTVDINNTISNRMSVNASDGLFGLIITARDAKGGVDPESTAQATHDFWAQMENATSTPLVANIGKTIGSRMFVAAPTAQYTGLAYKDRVGIRTNDAALSFSQVNGDDEFSFFLG
jgi:hypothetical protein